MPRFETVVSKRGINFGENDGKCIKTKQIHRKYVKMFTMYFGLLLNMYSIVEYLQGVWGNTKVVCEFGMVIAYINLW